MDELLRNDLSGSLHLSPAGAAWPFPTRCVRKEAGLTTPGTLDLGRYCTSWPAEEKTARSAPSRALADIQSSDGERDTVFKQSPIVRYRRADDEALAQLTEYFARNAGALAPRHRATIARALASQMGGNLP